MAESRIQKSLLNAKVNLIFYALTLALSFFSRKIFLNCLGADFVGLTGTLQNLLGFLNLAELGIGAAIGYVLYKPLFDKDQTKINEIISVFGFLYKWIGLIILALGGLLACFLPLIFKETGFDLSIIYAAYFTFLTSSLIGYFINYKQTLLGADQKNYVVTAYFQTTTILKTIIQMASAWYTGSYYLWVIIEFCFGIIYSCILNWKINQVYPWLKTSHHNGQIKLKEYKDIITYSKQVFCHKLGWLVRFQMSGFLVYCFSSLKDIAFYQNYTIILDKLLICSSQIFSGISSGVGNLIAEGNKEKIMRVYWELLVVRTWFTGFMALSIFSLTQSFIVNWLGTEYLLSNTILALLVINFFLDHLRSVNEQYLFGYGLFNDTWAPMVEVILTLTISIGSGITWGIPGVIWGNIISNLIIAYAWKVYFLFKKAFKQSASKFYRQLVISIFILLVSWYISIILLSQNLALRASISFIGWLLYAICLCSIFGIISATITYVTCPSSRQFVHRFVKTKKI